MVLVDIVLLSQDGLDLSSTAFSLRTELVLLIHFEVVFIDFLVQISKCWQSIHPLLKCVRLPHHFIQLDPQSGELLLDEILTLPIHLIFYLVQISEELLLTI